MKKRFSLCFIIVFCMIIAQLPISSAFSFPFFFRIGISGKVIDSLRTGQEQSDYFNLTIVYEGYENYTDYNWKLVKTDYIDGMEVFLWSINDFAEAVRIKTPTPVLISQSNAILAFKQVSIGSCLKCNEVSSNLLNKEFINKISAVIKGKGMVYVYLGTNIAVKKRYIRGSIPIGVKIGTNKLILGKISDFINPAQIQLEGIKYSLNINHKGIKAYFSDGSTSTKDIESTIIVERI